MQGPPVNPRLSDDDVRKVARLSKLAVADADLDRERTRLEAVLGYVERLRELDLEGVEPMPRASEEPARLREDTPGEALKGDTLATLAPDVFEHHPDGFGTDAGDETDLPADPPTERFIRVPKVLGEGGA
tara:strand:- start:26 stop:415 length:390 start_codon:yes stop_codon:yes gene_type:complete